MKAVVACRHKLLRIIYKVLADGVHYDREKALRLRQQSKDLISILKIPYVYYNIVSAFFAFFTSCLCIFFQIKARKFA
ncbi:hypothetical protein, partial [Halolactibacillus alkaliphilus]|uniref:hypothetical protein n=1 Tax=Halolactibacillus alkaliphilus TaxID=442899 RepID=UPI0011BDEF19